MENLTKTQKELVKISLKKGFKTWGEIREYARNFSKYDNLSFRNIDTVLYWTLKSL